MKSGCIIELKKKINTVGLEIHRPRFRVTDVSGPKNLNGQQIPEPSIFEVNEVVYFGL